MPKILIFTPDTVIGNIMASAVADLADEVVCATTACDMDAALCRGRLALIIIASTRSLGSDVRLDLMTEYLHRRGIPVFVVLEHLSESRATRLLQCGIEQCMTFPINMHRLRRKVRDVIINRSSPQP